MQKFDIPTNFRIQQQNNELLVTPEMAVGNSCWKNWRDRWLRSLHLDANDGHIISCGWPKFMNLCEGLDKYKTDIYDLYYHSKNGILATLKFDGTLLIRYVQNGKVKFRTRGSFKVGVDNRDELKIFEQKYPKLFNPKFYSNISLLLEWTTPTNTIIIKYSEPELILIGAINYAKNVSWRAANIMLIRWSDLRNISQILNVKLPHYFYIDSSNQLDQLIEQLKHDKEIEGFVLRFDDEQKLVKLKTKHYFLLHGLKSNLNINRLIDLWLEWNKPIYTVYKQNFIDIFDYEGWIFAKDMIDAMYKSILKVYDDLAEIKLFVDQMRHIDRKRFAKAARTNYDGTHLSSCFIFLDNKELNVNSWKKLILGEYND